MKLIIEWESHQPTVSARGMDDISAALQGFKEELAYLGSVTRADIELPLDGPGAPAVETPTRSGQ